MFRIDSFEERNGEWFIRIACQFTDSEILFEETTCKSKRQAMNWFSGMATEFLQGQVDEFNKVIRFIKPAYFDKKTTPYMSLAHDWRMAYWKFTCEVVPELSTVFHQAGAYAAAILKSKIILETLIPSLVELGKVELNFILNDILKLAKDITETLYRMKQKDLTQLFNQKIA